VFLSSASPTNAEQDGNEDAYNTLRATVPDIRRAVKIMNGEGKRVVTFRSWPYSLPSFLQPKNGTTFSLMNSTITTSASDTCTKRTGILQAILYGVPDPERFPYRQEMVASGSFLHKIL
jgi:hypothetical protein